MKRRGFLGTLGAVGATLALERVGPTPIAELRPLPFVVMSSTPLPPELLRIIEAGDAVVLPPGCEVQFIEAGR